MMLRSSDGGTMALTLSQAFLGALTVGIGLSRGIEADLSFFAEGLTGEANYAAARLAAAHARAANAIADDNVLAVAAMAPRLAVEADNIAMDESAKIACPRKDDPRMRFVCDEYTKNKPRAAAKLAWIREKQTSLWGSLEKLSSDMDKVARMHGREDVRKTLGAMDPEARVGFDDPTESRDTWGKRSAHQACTLAKKDALASDMVGHAFPLLMPNLLEHLPRALVAALPSALCPDMTESGPIALGDVPEVREKAEEECDEVAAHMRSQLEWASSSSSDPTFSTDVEGFVKCTVMTTRAPRRIAPSSPTFVVRRKGRLVTCTFDRAACTKKKLESGSASFLESLGLSSIPSFGSIGGSTRSPGAAKPNESDDFRASAWVERPANQGTAAIADAARALMSFGGAPAPTPLRQNVRRTSTAKWYFPSGSGSPLAGVPREQQAFVSAWKHALVAGRPEKKP